MLPVCKSLWSLTSFFIKFIYQNKMLGTFQWGFKPGHSTVIAMLKITSDIRNGVKDAIVTVLVLIDFSNTFSTVNHDILLSIFPHYMVYFGGVRSASIISDLQIYPQTSSDSLVTKIWRQSKTVSHFCRTYAPTLSFTEPTQDWLADNTIWH